MLLPLACFIVIALYARVAGRNVPA
jgi:hypothetical protein